MAPWQFFEMEDGVTCDIWHSCCHLSLPPLNGPLTSPCPWKSVGQGNRVILIVGEECHHFRSLAESVVRNLYSNSSAFTGESSHSWCAWPARTAQTCNQYRAAKGSWVDAATVGHFAALGIWFEVPEVCCLKLFLTGVHWESQILFGVESVPGIKVFSVQRKLAVSHAACYCLGE